MMKRHGQIPEQLGFGWLSIVMVALGLFVAPVRGEEPDVDTYDDWYAVLIDGQRSGWAHMYAHRDGDNVTRTEEINLVVRRGQVQLPIRMVVRFTESADHKPIQIVTQQSLAAQETLTVLRFRDDHLEMVSGDRSHPVRSKLPLPQGDWLTPGAAQRHIVGEIAKGAATIAVRTMDATMGPRVIESKMTLLGRENVEVFGREVPAIVWDMTSDALAGVVSREYVDELGRTIKSTVHFAGMQMTMLATDEQLARAKVDPPELMAKTLVTPQGKIAKARELRRAVYDLALTNNGQGVALSLPSVGVQTVSAQGNGLVRVTIDRDQAGHQVDDQPTAAHLAATTMLNHQDPKIRQLLVQALGEKSERVPTDAAGKLSRFVAHYLRDKNLGVGFATASETARTASGDCSEHAVLLAALLRAAGIPSRTVSGLIYVDEFLGHTQVFGYHMWAQAWLVDGAGSGRWVDLDATLDDGGYDAAHITISVNAMADGDRFNDMLNMVPMLGGLSITVVEPQ